jgi:hypothetical protein
MRILRFEELFTRYSQLRLNSAVIDDLNPQNLLANTAEREFAGSKWHCFRSLRHSFAIYRKIQRLSVLYLMRNSVPWQLMIRALLVTLCNS